MAKWSNRSKSLSVKVYYTPKGRAQITIPAPIVNGLDKPDTVTFYLQDNGIWVDFTKTVKTENV